MHFKITSPFRINKVYEHPDQTTGLYVVDIIGDELTSRKVSSLKKFDPEKNEEVEEIIEEEMVVKSSDVVITEPIPSIPAPAFVPDFTNFQKKDDE